MKTERAILLVDNTSCRSVRANIENFTPKFFPPNMAAKNTAFGAGIIRIVKVHYRSELVRHYIACAKPNERQTFDLGRCFQKLKRAWDAAAPLNCWRHAGILVISSAIEEDDPMDGLSLMVLCEALRQLGAKNSDGEALAFSEIEDETKTWKRVRGEQILELVGRSAQRSHQLEEGSAQTEAVNE